MKTKGFTLIEIMVAISIVAVLSLTAFVTYGNLTKRSRDTRRASDLEQIRQALEMFRSAWGYYPALGGTCRLASSDAAFKLTLSPFMSVVPTDPKNTGYYVYYYKALPPVISGNYYAYCLAGSFEGTPPTSSCPATTCAIGQNYGLGNP